MTKSSEGKEFNQPVKDPWKALRGVMAGILILEAIVVLLALPVVATVGGGLTFIGGFYLIGLAVMMIGGAGLQGKSWALAYNLGLQAAVIFGFFLHLAITVVGLIFLFVWLYVLYLRRDIRERLELGLLPGQRD